MTTRPGSRLGSYPAILAAGIVANGARLRSRLGRLATLDHTEPVPPDHDLFGPGAEPVWIVARGVELDAATRAATAAWMNSEDLDVVDVVPADLPVNRALEVARMVDPGTYRTDPLAPGRGAFQALCARREVMERAGFEPGSGRSPGEMVAALTELKRCAPLTTDVVVAPLLSASPQSPGDRAELMAALFDTAAGPVAAVAGAEYAALAAGPFASGGAGVAALAAYWLQPAAVFAGGPAGLRPRDLPATTAARGLRDVISWGRTALTPTRNLPGARARAATVAALRPSYAEAVAEGTSGFFEERRTTCPWCSSEDLREEIRTDDLLQHKPGEFVIDRCGGCGHLFQNPRLSLAGLDYYYRDFYDGLGEAASEFVFGASSASYEARVDMVVRHCRPHRWLDVGAGHGHFCLIAGRELPDTVFDGLDLSESIDAAARRGWVNVGYHGLFPERAAELAGTYDVVSMHHYLEHTREPFDELDAAAAVLPSGGHLLIEVPDPESRFGRILGRRWVPWFQPQHQHLIPIHNLEVALAERGFTVIESERGPAHQPVDFVLAAWFLANEWGPEPDVPWAGAPRLIDRVRRVAGLTAAAPLIAAGFAVDQAVRPLVRRRGGGNTYRVLARRD